MSNDYTHYVFIDSSKRDRTLYPYPGDFVVNNNSGDIVLQGLQLAVFLASSAVTATSNSTLYQITIPALSSSILDTEVVGSYLYNNANGQYARILGITSIRTTLYLDRTMSVTIGDSCRIRQLTPSSSTTTITAISGNDYSFSVPITGNNYIWKTTTGEVSHITSYNSTTGYHRLSPDPGTYSVSDTFEIRGWEYNSRGMILPPSVSRNVYSNHLVKLEWLQIPRQKLFVNTSNVSIVDFPYVNIVFAQTGNVFQSNNQTVYNSQFINPACYTKLNNAEML